MILTGREQNNYLNLNLKLIKIFLITENKEETKKRLKNRNQNTASELEKI